MKYELYVIFDRISGRYAAPVPHVNVGCARRWFSDVVSKDPHGQDFELYSVGEYDSVTASIVAFHPTFICRFGDIMSEVDNG